MFVHPNPVILAQIRDIPVVSWIMDNSVLLMTGVIMMLAGVALLVFLVAYPYRNKPEIIRSYMLAEMRRPAFGGAWSTSINYAPPRRFDA